MSTSPKPEQPRCQYSGASEPRRGRKSSEISIDTGHCHDMDVATDVASPFREAVSWKAEV